MSVHEKLVASLKKDQLASFHMKIMEEATTADLTKLLQGKFKVHAADAYINVYRKVERYVKWYRSQPQVKDPSGNTVTAENLESYVKNYNALEKLTDLCKTQEGRVAKMINKETAMGKDGMLIKMATDEIKQFSFMLKDLADVQIKAGVIVQAPKVYPKTVFAEEEAARDVLQIPVTDAVMTAIEKLAKIDD